MKQVDPRIRTLIENGVKARHRSFFVIVGDNANEQIPNLHLMLSKAEVKARPTVLWCYKENLGFTAFVYFFMLIFLSKSSFSF